MDLMPERMQRTVKYMVREDWLGSYRDLAGIDVALNRLSRRIRFDNHMDGSIEEVVANYNHIEAGFDSFFPALLEFVENRRGGVDGLERVVSIVI